MNEDDLICGLVDEYTKLRDEDIRKARYYQGCIDGLKELTRRQIGNDMEPYAEAVASLVNDGMDWEEALERVTATMSLDAEQTKAVAETWREYL